MSGTAQLVEDSFEVVEIPEKKFDLVTRIVCRSENYDLEMTLDVHSELFKVSVRDKFTLLLASTLSLDGSAPPSEFILHDKNDTGSLADKFDYVMHGQIFEIEEKSGGSQVDVTVSFGGLLMSLKGDSRHLKRLELDNKIYLLLRKVF